MNQNKFPYYNWMYYLRIIPWPEVAENLINSVKSNLWSLRATGNRYSIESYYYRHNNTIRLEQFIASNKAEWLSFIMNFFHKLYNGKVNFSISIPSKLISKIHYPVHYKIGLKNHGILSPKTPWAVGWDDFLSSSSILAWVFKESELFIPEKGIIKSTFSFTKGSYSLLIKERLFRKHTKGMDDEDKKQFLASFPDGTELFQFRWDIQSNISSSEIQSIIEKNIGLYSSILNRYELMKKKNIFSIIPPRKRILSSEWILSHWLFIPVSNYGPMQSEPIITPSEDLYSAGFILP